MTGLRAYLVAGAAVALAAAVAFAWVQTTRLSAAQERLGSALAEVARQKRAIQSLDVALAEREAAVRREREAAAEVRREINRLRGTAADRPLGGLLEGYLDAVRRQGR